MLPTYNNTVVITLVVQALLFEYMWCMKAKKKVRKEEKQVMMISSLQRMIIYANTAYIDLLCNLRKKKIIIKRRRRKIEIW